MFKKSNKNLHLSKKLKHALQQGRTNFLARGPHLEDDFGKEPHQYLQRQFVAQAYSKVKKCLHFNL